MMIIKNYLLTGKKKLKNESEKTIIMVLMINAESLPVFASLYQNYWGFCSEKRPLGMTLKQESVQISPFPEPVLEKLQSTREFLKNALALSRLSKLTNTRTARVALTTLAVINLGVSFASLTSCDASDSAFGPELITAPCSTEQMEKMYYYCSPMHNDPERCKEFPTNLETNNVVFCGRKTAAANSTFCLDARDRFKNPAEEIHQFYVIVPTELEGTGWGWDWEGCEISSEAVTWPEGCLYFADGSWGEQYCDLPADCQKRDDKKDRNILFLKISGAIVALGASLRGLLAIGERLPAHKKSGPAS